MRKRNKRQNYRRCISCHQIKDKNSFLRVVRTFPEGQIRLKSGMGRSAYICPDHECILVAQKQKKLSKALKSEIPTYIYEKLRQELREHS